MHDSDETARGGRLFSILIGLVSTEDRERILETLEELRQQEGGAHFEVIIADRRRDDVSRAIAARYPDVRLIASPAGTSLPELRTRALECAAGDVIVVTEDHCVPPRDWLARIDEAFSEAPSGTVAVGGCVENGVVKSDLDWATFFCEYSAFLSPVTEGTCRSLPGMNVAYLKRAFSGVDRSLLSKGFWETTLHPLLLERGLVFYSSNKIRMFHSKKFSFRLFASQRYIYSRYYAGLRFENAGLPRRLCACALSALLPGVLLARASANILGKKRLYKEFAWALPRLSAFFLIWTFGEMIGAIAGPSDALSRIE